MKPFCVNETCENFLPEDKRGYYKKKETDEATEPPVEETAEKKKATAKAGTKKTTAKKTAAGKTAKSKEK